MNDRRRIHPKARGLVLVNGKYEHPPEVCAKVVALYTEHGSQVVERITGLHRSEVIKIARRHGVEIRTTQARPSRKQRTAP